MEVAESVVSTESMIKVKSEPIDGGYTLVNGDSLHHHLHDDSSMNGTTTTGEMDTSSEQPELGQEEEFVSGGEAGSTTVVTNGTDGTTTILSASCQVCGSLPLSANGSVVNLLEESQALQLKIFLEEEVQFATMPVAVCTACYSLLSDLRYLESTFVAKKTELQARRQRLRRDGNGTVVVQGGGSSDHMTIPTVSAAGITGATLIQGGTSTAIDLNQLVETVGIVPSAAVTVTNAATGAIVATTDKAILAAKQQLHRQQKNQVTLLHQNYSGGGNGGGGGALKQHNAQVAPYLCPFENCGRRYVLKRSLKEHERGHLEGKCHKCRFCGKGFRRHKDLRVHELLHSDRSRFPCPFCPKGFVIRSRLTRHMKIHDSASVFGCRVSTCGAKFHNKEDALAHSQLEHGGTTMESMEGHGESEGELDEEDEQKEEEMDEDGGSVHEVKVDLTTFQIPYPTGAGGGNDAGGGPPSTSSSTVGVSQEQQQQQHLQEHASANSTAGQVLQNHVVVVSSSSTTNGGGVPVVVSSHNSSLVTVSLDEAWREAEEDGGEGGASIHTPPHHHPTQIKLEAMQEEVGGQLHHQDNNNLSASPFSTEAMLKGDGTTCIPNPAAHVPEDHLHHAAGGVAG